LIAPPSIHPEGHIYAWSDGGPEVIRTLPPFDVRALHRVLEAHAKRTQVPGRIGMRDGSRKLFLNDKLCAAVAFTDSLDDLLDFARSLNLDFFECGLEALSDETVMKIVKDVSRDFEAGHIDRWARACGVARVRREEIDGLARRSRRGGSDAVVLLALLRITHSARCRRGETFALAAASMAAAGVISGWSRERYRRARDLLLEAGLIERVSACRVMPTGRVPAQYRLCPAGGAAV
jgi:hypothetical protein